MKKDKVLEQLHIGSDALKGYLLIRCTEITNEQKTLNAVCGMIKACNGFRSKLNINKIELINLYNDIDKIQFKNISNVNNFKKEIKTAINNYDKYYDRNGLRRH